MLIAHSQSIAADRQGGQHALFGADPAAGRPRLKKIDPWNQVDLLDEELAAVGFYLTGHPLEDMVGMLRRRRTAMLTEVIPQAEAGMEAFRMCGVVRRRPGARLAERRALCLCLHCRIPPAKCEVLFRRKPCESAGTCWSRASRSAIKVRAKARDGSAVLRR